jgi:glycosyltransferase involved in cell wall biosynthesis
VAEAEARPVRVFFDASRLVARNGASPTGIDRVDFAYLSALRQAAGFDLRLLCFDALGPRLLRQDAAARLFESVTRRWDAPSSLHTDASFLRLRHWLESPAGTVRPELGTTPKPMLDAGRLSSAVGGAARRTGEALRLGRLQRGAAIPSLYLNTSHGGLFRPAVARWLAASGSGGVFFVHDLVPLDYPEFCRPKEPARHAARMLTVSAHARQVLVNSAATRQALLRHFAGHGLRQPPVDVLPLGVEPRFNDSMGLPPLHPAVPYFVVLSTIEPRKNHLLLLQVWRRWIEAAGPAAARLVILGRRGWENQAVFNMLDRLPLLRGHVIECAGLGDAQLGVLLRGARALLSPTFAEGFGLPVAEGLASGTPVLASAIEAHREVGGDYAEYLDPLDGSAWLQAVQDYSAAPAPRREQRLRLLAQYRAPDWQAHFAQAIELLRHTAHARIG